MRLEDSEITDKLTSLPGWERDGDSIVREFDCGDFVGSVRFVDSVVGPAEDLNHHPDVEISWATVKLRLSTHSAGGLTASDFELASRIDRLY